MSQSTRSLLVAITAFLAALTAQAQAPAGGDPILHHARPAAEVRVAGIYDPKDAVRLHSVRFDVPPKKLLIMTGLGSFQGGQATVQIGNFWPSGGFETISVNTLPSAPIVSFPAPGIVVPTGATVYTGVPLAPTGIVYGYLVDAPNTKGKARAAEPQQNVVRIVGIPGDPREYVYIRSNPQNPNDSYTVPMGKRLIITALGGSRDCTSATVNDTGTLLLYVEPPAGSLFYQLPAPGIPVAPGRVVNPVASSPADPFPGRVIGYLIEE